MNKQEVRSRMRDIAIKAAEGDDKVVDRRIRNLVDSLFVEPKKEKETPTYYFHVHAMGRKWQVIAENVKGVRKFISGTDILIIKGKEALAPTSCLTRYHDVGIMELPVGKNYWEE